MPVKSPLEEVGPEDLVLIDSNAFLHRAYHALPEMSTSDGFPTNALHGYISMLRKLKITCRSRHIVAVWDSPRSTNYRLKILPEYKISRVKTDEEVEEDKLGPQFEPAKKVPSLMGLTSFEIKGYEADDILFCAASMFRNSGNKTYIVTSDKDLMQTKRFKNVEIYDPMSDALKTQEDLIKKFGVSEWKLVPDVQATLGDKGDDIPGVDGIGLVGAAHLINTYGSIRKSIKAVEEANDSGEKLKRPESLLLEHSDMAKVSYKLASLSRSPKLKNKLKKILVNNTKGVDPNSKELAKLLEKYELTSLAERLNLKTNTKPKRRKPKKNKRASKAPSSGGLF